MSWANEAYTVATAKEYITITQARWEERTLFAFAITRSDEILGGCTFSSIHSGTSIAISVIGCAGAGMDRALQDVPRETCRRFAFEKVGLVVWRL